MEETVLSPLGMSHSTIRPTEDQLQQCPRTYRQTKEGLESEPRDNLTQFLDDGYETHGIKFSTIDDIGRYLLFHLNRGKVDGNRLVSAEALQQSPSAPRN